MAVVPSKKSEESPMIEKFSPSRLATVHDIPRRCHHKAVQAYGSGLIIRRQGATYRPGYDASRFLSEAPGVEELAWCWHFTNWGKYLDTPHGWIQGVLKATIRAAFEHVTTFEFHLWQAVPPLPDWLDEEFVPSLNALSLYGDKGES
jgi:hypothetical protein